MNLPTGTITFLFTDIESSTQLWEEHPYAMREALEQHDNLLRAAIESNNGYVFKTVGDAFCAAFSTASEAIGAALEAQLAMAAAEWGATGLLRVRMGLHSGTATERNNDYFGPTVNRVARIQAIGHGQQILLSLAAHGQIARAVPDGAVLVEMGRHRLKDLAEPENVWQLTHPDLPQEFPPLRSLDYLNTNLSQQLSTFVGREKQMQEVKEQLHQSSLLTLTGSGGCGKTRLAVHVGADVLEQYSDGVWVVELAPLTDSALVSQMVAQTLSIREISGEPLSQTLTAALKDRQMLIILDNCEHLLSASAHLVEDLLTSCPRLKVLATSREALGIAGERVYRTPSLSVPPPKDKHGTRITVESLLEYESVRLFHERAVAARRDFTVTPQNAPSLAAVCHRLDGIPLAIELAAVRVRAMPIEQIETRLDSRFRLLTGGPRDALPRQQTLRALIDWSYDLLSTQEQTLLNRLSVFSGGWTLDAAERVCDALSSGRDEGRGMRDEKTSRDSEKGGGFGAFPSTLNSQPSTTPASSLIPHPSSLDALTSLCDKSLVVSELVAGATRYRLLESVRQYALDKLIESGESELLRERHMAHFVHLAESAGDKLGGEEQEYWLGRLETEHDNLRAAFDYCMKQANVESGLSLAGNLSRFWMIRGHVSEGRRRCAEVLNVSDTQRPSAPLAKAVHTAGNLAYVQGEYEAARSFYEQAADMRHELGDKAGEVGSRLNLATILQTEGRADVARGQFEHALEIFEELDDTYGMSVALGCLGSVATDQLDFHASMDYFNRAIEAARKLGSLSAEANSLNNLGTTYRQLGDEASSRRCYEEALAINTKLGYSLEMALTQVNLSLAHLRDGDVEGAKAHLTDSIAKLKAIGARANMSSWMETVAEFEVAMGRLDRAVCLLGAAAAHRIMMKTPLPRPEAGPVKAMQEELLATLGQQAFTEAYDKGSAMDFNTAIEYGLESCQNSDLSD